LIAEDHTIVREGLLSLLSYYPEIVVVGEAINGRMAVEMAREKLPDVVLMDIGMPELNGFEATRQIKKYLPATHVLILSGHDSDEYVREIAQTGASGYLLKTSAPDELKKAIVAVTKGEKLFRLSNDIASAAPGEYPAANHPDRKDLPNSKALLTAREREILQLIGEGKFHAQIAETLHISIRTVDTHRNNILKKLGLHDAAGLVTYALKNGIIFLPE
jgi:DNA-binding NarL/FixJ family response regulator